MKELPPFNIELLPGDRQTLGHLIPVTVTDIWDSSTGDFHASGLYSPVIFGRVGERGRDTNYSVIKLHVKILNPLIYEILTTMRALYKDIMAGRAYVVFDEKAKDFVKSTPLDGFTGYKYFIDNLPKVKLASTGSIQRDNRLKILEEFKDVLLMDYFVLMPAGLREMENTSNGRPQEQEISKLYRKVLTTSANIPETLRGKDDRVLDPIRFNLQRDVNAVYDYLIDMLKGKRGAFQAKYSSRSIFEGTRNVLSAMKMDAANVDSPRLPKMNETQVGVMQFVKGTLPLIRYQFRNDLCKNIYTSGPEVNVIDFATRKLMQHRARPNEMERWTTRDGFEKLVNRLNSHKFRRAPANIDGHFIKLIHVGKDYFRLFDSYESVPSDYPIKEVRPITWFELFYIAAAQAMPEVRCYVTRYPVIGLGSMYPSRPRVRSTQEALIMRRVGADDPKYDEFVFGEFPKMDDGLAYIDTMIPHISTLEDLGGDYDGDTGSVNFVYMKESVKGIDEGFKDISTYVTPNGRLLHTLVTKISEWVMRNFR